MAKDFFDEEFEKQTQSQGESSNGGNDWFNRPAPTKEVQTTKRPIYVVLLCVALVLCVVLGWVLCTIAQGVGNYNTDGSADIYGDDILATVIDYLNQRFYKDIDDETWLKAIEYSGTALMQKAGDRYSQIMSPQTYYDYTHAMATAVSDEVFGVSFVVEEGVGLYVSSVVANSSAYGLLRDGDLVLKLSGIKDKNGNVLVVDGTEFDSMVLGEWSSTAVTTVLSAAHKATFHVLRFDSASEDGYEMVTVELERRKITQVVTDYSFNFIEFYFDDDNRNVSIPSDGLSYSTYEERHLDELPEGVGYVRITQFMDYTKLDAEGNVVLNAKGDPVMVSAADEFRQVMKLFKDKKLSRLVLDLKGNPGGSVAYVSDIAGMLVTDAHLSPEQQAAVASGDNKLLITTLTFPKFEVSQSHSRVSTYEYYFGNVSDKCSIVVWTDGGSASASELLTGALTDYSTAVQMGTTTYGKGIAQICEELPFYGTVTDINGGQTTYPWAIYYTCASYFSPLGNNIHGVGYTPAEPYNNLTTYQELWHAAQSYWN